MFICLTYDKLLKTLLQNVLEHCLAWFFFGRNSQFTKFWWLSEPWSNPSQEHLLNTKHTKHSTLTLFTTHCTQHTVHYTMYTTHCTLHTVHNTLYTTHCTLHTVHNTLYTKHCTQHTLHYTMYTTHSTLHTVHCTQQTTHHTLHTANCIMNFTL